jgi:hypothetical protein
MLIIISEFQYAYFGKILQVTFPIDLSQQRRIFLHLYSSIVSFLKIY